jgi:hypothetical protein
MLDRGHGIQGPSGGGAFLRDRGFLHAKAARLPGEARTIGSSMLKAFTQAESSVILRPTADNERYVSAQAQIRSPM